MTLFEVLIYGPFFCLVFAGAGSAMLQVTGLVDGRPWLGKVALALALVLATGATWTVGNFAGLNEPVAFNDYQEPAPLEYGRYSR